MAKHNSKVSKHNSTVSRAKTPVAERNAAVKKLNAETVKSITKPGRYSDGNGLYLNVTPTGSKSWVLRYSIAGQRQSIGLGSYPEVGLTQARRLTGAYREDAKALRDPVTGRYRPPTPTFAEAAREVHALNRARWSSEHHANFWLRSLELHAAPLWDMRLSMIEPRDVIACLQPQWTEKAETMRRVRQRITTVMRWGMAHDFIDINPAGEKISAALPPQPRRKSPLAAVHYLDLPDALATIRSSQATEASKACIDFIVLTAARSGEARLATWDEVDLNAAVWTVPAERMKRRIVHRVPLSTGAIDVLERARRVRDGSGLIFPSAQRPGHPMPAETLLKALRDHGISQTVHGFRSAFKTWAIECADTTWAVTEAALAHQVGNQTEAAYVRGDLFEKRRVLMEEWAQHVAVHRTEVADPEAARQRREARFLKELGWDTSAGSGQKPEDR